MNTDDILKDIRLAVEKDTKCIPTFHFKIGSQGNVVRFWVTISTRIVWPHHNFNDSLSTSLQSAIQGWYKRAIEYFRNKNPKPPKLSDLI